MPETQAMIGYGTVFEMADEATPTTFVAQAEVFEVTPPTEEQEEVEATHYQSPNRTREYIPGMNTAGEVSFQCNFVPGSATDIAIRGAVGKRNRGRITYPNGVRHTFPIVRRTYNPSVPLDDRMVATATWRVAGAVTIDSAEEPVNGVLPSIAGEIEVGETLTAMPGIWAPFATFTYQWKADGVNIGGATEQTYVPLVGDVGKALSVAVTATNTAGAVTAISAETVEVVA